MPVSYGRERLRSQGLRPSPDDMWHCPHCEAEIDHVDYHESTYGRAYGTINLETGSEQEDDCETTDSDDRGYSCPECSEDVNLEELTPIGVEEEGEHEAVILDGVDVGDTDAPIFRILGTGSNSNLFAGSNRSHITFTICPHCDMEFLVADDGVPENCPHCEKKLKRNTPILST